MVKNSKNGGVGKGLTYTGSNIGKYGIRAALSSAFFYLLLNTLGCQSMSQQALDERIQNIQQEHNITVKAESSSLRTSFLHDLPKFMDTIDKVFDKIPYKYFEEMVGPIWIEESFLDNIDYPFVALTFGYVNVHSEKEAKLGFPLHVRDRSIIEKIMLPSEKVELMIVDELTLSFIANMYINDPNGLNNFVNDFVPLRDRYYETYVGKMLSFALNVSTSMFTTYFHERGSRGEYVSMLHKRMYTNGYDFEVLKQKFKDPIIHQEFLLLDKLFSGGHSTKPIEVKGPVYSGVVTK